VPFVDAVVNPVRIAPSPLSSSAGLCEFSFPLPPDVGARRREAADRLGDMPGDVVDDIVGKD
jgi:hypothetical protein